MATDKNVAITLTVNGKQFQAEMRQAGDEVRGFGRSAPVAGAEFAQLTSILKGAAGVAAAAVVATGAAVARLAVQGFQAVQTTSEAADRLGISFNQFQALTLAAESSGLGMDNVTKSASKLAVAFSDSFAGKIGASSEALEKLGITSEDVQRVQNDSVGQLKLVADGFSRMESGAERTALATRLLGDEGADLVRVLQQGGAVFDEAAESAERFGLLLSDEAVKGVNDADDAVDEFSARLKGLKQQLGAEIAPAIEALAKSGSLLLRSFRGEGIYINAPTPDQAPGLPRGNQRFGLGGAIPSTERQSAEEAFRGLQGAQIPRTNVLLGNSPETARRDLVSDQLIASLASQTEALQKLTAVEKVRRDLLKENIPLESRQAKAALDAAQALDDLRKRTLAGGAGQSESLAAQRQQEQLVRRQQERNLLLETELRLGRQITGAQADLLLLNTQLAPVADTSLKVELEKTEALESQTETLREQARLKKEAERIATAEVDRFLRDTAPRSEGRDGIQSIRDEGDNGTRAALDEVYQNTLNNERAALEEQLLQLEALRAQAREAGLQRDAEFDEREVQLRTATNERLAQADRAYQATKDQLREQELQRAGDFFGNLATVAQAFGKKGFAAYKAFATAQAIISTYESATKAYSSLASVPIVGPALGAAAAAAAVAAGLAQVRAIQSQQPSGREFGGPVGPNGLVQVGERNKPELLRSGGKTYLIPGDQGGSVSPAQQASAGGGGAPIINIYRAPAGVESVNTRTNANGGLEIDILFEQLDQRMAAGYARGTSALSKQMAVTSGLSRVPGAR